LGLIGAFLLATALGLAMGARSGVARYTLPLLTLIQGIPALSWVVIAIIWFQNVELRIWFIVVAVTLPGYTFQIYDSYRAIPQELREMARSLRPRRFGLFRTVTLPAILPDILTAWKVNIGLGMRVVLVAELVGAAIGVGYQLLSSQQRFDMVGVVAWTGVLVIFVLIVQQVITRLENYLLRYRPSSESQPGAERRQQAGAET
jgi:NitT/TauT family transport system permease protein